VFCSAVDTGGKKIWADEFMRKKPNQRPLLKLKISDDMTKKMALRVS
jgi:hypothetical protein